ncbi:MAG: anion permease [Candidatus Zixiibacteriota bacterium]
MILVGLFLVTVFLAYANGANDNFKGVATLFGSRTANYRVALGWATITTMAGSLCSVFLADKLIKAFSGKGLVPVEITTQPEFLLAVACGAGATVMLATVTGFPISTTHSLVGALVGGGLVAAGSDVNIAALGKGYFGPLMISPIVAVALSAVLYTVFRYGREKLGVTKEYCLCAGNAKEVVAVAAEPFNVQLKSSSSQTAQIDIDKEQVCIERYCGRFMGINLERILDFFHFISAGVVSFARGLNDTPKIMGLLLVVNALDIRFGMGAIAVAIAVGGLLNARKVAHVMSYDITYLNHGQGFTANIVTGALVLFASRLGVPVSTTHVSVGSLFGIGAVNRQADYGVIRRIVASWVLTLPISAVIAAAVAVVLMR